jgi:hypothetical protein
MGIHDQLIASTDTHQLWTDKASMRLAPLVHVFSLAFQIGKAVVWSNELSERCETLWQETTLRKQGKSTQEQVRWLIEDALYYGDVCLSLFMCLMRGEKVEAKFTGHEAGEEYVTFHAESEDGERRIVRIYAHPKYGQVPHTHVRSQGRQIRWMIGDKEVPVSVWTDRSGNRNGRKENT